MVDVFRVKHPDVLDAYTCFNTKLGGRSNNFGTRIDYILCSASLKDQIEACEIRRDLGGSDHLAVVAGMVGCRVPCRCERRVGGEGELCWTAAARRNPAEDPQLLPEGRDAHGEGGEAKSRGEHNRCVRRVGVCAVHVPQPRGQGVLRDVWSEEEEAGEGGDDTHRFPVWWEETRRRSAVLGTSSSLCSSSRWGEEGEMIGSPEGGKEQGAVLLLLSAADRVQERPEGSVQLLPVGVRCHVSFSALLVLLARCLLDAE